MKTIGVLAIITHTKTFNIYIIYVTKKYVLLFEKLLQFLLHFDNSNFLVYIKRE